MESKESSVHLNEVEKDAVASSVEDRQFAHECGLRACDAASDDYQAMLQSHITTREGYGWATRVEEIMLYARNCAYHTIGVAFCMTLAREAAVFCDVLRDNGFAVSSVICKTGSLNRELLKDDFICDRVPGMGKTLCNPVGQAELLNREQTDLNVVLGLCVGHDALFIRHSEAPVTYLAVKDRIMGHAPLMPIYLHQGLYTRIHDVFGYEESKGQHA